MLITRIIITSLLETVNNSNMSIIKVFFAVVLIFNSDLLYILLIDINTRRNSAYLQNCIAAIKKVEKLKLFW